MPRMECSGPNSVQELIIVFSKIEPRTLPPRLLNPYTPLKSVPKAMSATIGKVNHTANRNRGRIMLTMRPRTDSARIQPAMALH